MPWSQTPEELVDTKTISVVSKNTAFPVYEAGQPLRLYVVSGLNPFSLLIFTAAVYGLILPFLPLHTPDYSDAWEVPYSPGG